MLAMGSSRIEIRVESGAENEIAVSMESSVQ
jgi:hypothetical protein